MGNSNNSIPSCLGVHYIGGALYCPPLLGIDGSPFKPLICLVTKKSDEPFCLTLSIQKISKVPPSNPDSPVSVISDVVIAETDYELSEQEVFQSAEHLVMGDLPIVLVLCKSDYIVLILRQFGVILVYTFIEGNLSLIGESRVEKFIVDASICRQKSDLDDIEVVAMVHLPNSSDIQLCHIKVLNTRGEF